MTIEEVEKELKKDCMQDAILIGTSDERHKYYPAIIGFDEEKGTVTYDYELLAECFADDFFDPSEKDADYGQSMIDAYEWIDYNVIRALPYWGKHAPVIFEKEED